MSYEKNLIEQVIGGVKVEVSLSGDAVFMVGYGLKVGNFFDL